MRSTTKSWGEVIGGCVLALIIAFLLDLLLAWVIQLLWNALVPTLFHGPTIGYWTAFLLMCALSIVGSFFKSSTSKK